MDLPLCLVFYICFFLEQPRAEQKSQWKVWWTQGSFVTLWVQALMTGHVTKIGYFGRFKIHDKIIKHKLFPKKKKKIWTSSEPRAKVSESGFFSSSFWVPKCKGICKNPLEKVSSWLNEEKKLKSKPKNVSLKKPIYFTKSWESASSATFAS